MDKEKKFDAFLTHDWGPNPENFNHHRVAAVNDMLKARGVKTWFDSERMEGDIFEQMCDGIESSRIAIVFITRRYIAKVASDNSTDNCKLEFKHCMRTMKPANMIACVMEKEALSTDDWIGPVGMALGSALYIDMSSPDLTDHFEELCGQLRRKGLHISAPPAKAEPDPFASFAPVPTDAAMSSPTKPAPTTPNSKDTGKAEDIPALIQKIFAGEGTPQKEAASKLLSLSYKNEDNCAVIVEKGLQMLVAAIPSADDAVKQSLFGVLWNICLHQRFRHTVYQATAGDAALEALRKGSSYAKMFCNTCGLIRALATETDLQVDLASKGAIDLLVKCVAAHGSEKEVAREAVAALGNIACNKKNLPLCRLQKMGTAIANVIRSHPKVEDTCQAAFSAMWQYTIDEQNQLDMAEHGGIELCLEAMHTFSTKTAILKNVCGALRAISCQGPNQDKLQKLDGANKLIAFIRTEVQNPESVRQAVAAFWNFAKEEPKQIELAQKGGIEAILDVIRTHPADADTQALACGAVRALAVARDNKAKIAQKGGVQALTTALRANLSHVHVFRQVVAALWNLALDADLQLRIAKSLALDLVLEAMWLHLGPQTTVEGLEAIKFSCGTLRALGAHPDNRMLLLERNCHEAIVEVMKKHPDDKGILEQGAAALWNMSVIPECKARFKECGVLLYLDSLRVRQTEKAVLDMIDGALKSIRS